MSNPNIEPTNSISKTTDRSTPSPQSAQTGKLPSGQSVKYPTGNKYLHAKVGEKVISDLAADVEALSPREHEEAVRDKARQCLINPKNESHEKTKTVFQKSLTRLDKKTGERYLDETKLIKGRLQADFIPPSKQYNETHRDFYLHQAMYRESLEHAKNPGLINRLERGILRGYGKAAKPGDESTVLGIQTSPLAHKKDEYHRSSPANILNLNIHKDFAEAMGFNEGDVAFTLVDSPLVTEVLDRHLPPPSGLDLKIDSKRKFESLVDQLFSNAKKGEFPQTALWINCTGLFPAGKEPKEIKELARELEQVILDKTSDFIDLNPEFPLDELQNRLLAHLQIVATSQFKGEHLLLTPKILDNPNVLKNQKQKDLISQQFPLNS